MQHVISMSTWCSLPNEVRHRIRTVFQIPRSSNVVVNDGRIESDGSTYEDLKALSVDKMQEYLHEEMTDFHKLFDMVVARVNEELIEARKPKVVAVDPTAGVTVVIEPTKRPYAKKKQK